MKPYINELISKIYHSLCVLCRHFITNEFFFNLVSVGAITGTVVLAVVGIIATVGIIVLCRRRRSQGRVIRSQQETVPLAQPGGLKLKKL